MQRRLSPACGSLHGDPRIRSGLTVARISAMSVAGRQRRRNRRRPRPSGSRSHRRSRRPGRRAQATRSTARWASLPGVQTETAPDISAPSRGSSRSRPPTCPPGSAAPGRGRPSPPGVSVSASGPAASSRFHCSVAFLSTDFCRSAASACLTAVVALLAGARPRTDRHRGSNGVRSSYVDAVITPRCKPYAGCLPACQRAADRAAPGQAGCRVVAGKHRVAPARLEGADQVGCMPPARREARTLCLR